MEKEWQTAFKCDLTRIKKKKKNKTKNLKKRYKTKQNKAHNFVYIKKDEEREQR